MFIQIFEQLKCISQSRWYWLMYIVAGISALAAALYYQHVLEELPCVVCIQIRLLISLLVIVSVIGLLSRNKRVVNSLAHLSVVIIAISFVERCYLLLGTEKGFIFSDCGFSLGLPAWFAIEEWLPWLYRIETSCGYTPEIIFGITMAEILMVMSVMLFLISFSVFAAIFVNTKPEE
ncbi:MAG: disulfide bond formation protein B [Gammaproteobacteria bacterium]|nr:disulfide bond formation protein B [Gammaproteobacteria bacterium]